MLDEGGPCSGRSAGYGLGREMQILIWNIVSEFAHLFQHAYNFSEGEPILDTGEYHCVDSPKHAMS